MVISALIKRMRELGAPMEAIEVAVEAIEAAQAADVERKAKRAAQKARERAVRKEPEGSDSRATVARQSGDSRSDTSPQENNTQPPSESEGEGAREPASDWPEDYRDQTWAAYGQNREKKVSNQALDQLRRSGKVPWSEFIAGVRRQAEHVEQKFRPSLERFVKREKWTDEYAAPPNGGARQHSFRVVNGSNGHVQASGRSAAQFLRADIERELREAGGEGERIRGLELLPQFGRG